MAHTGLSLEQKGVWARAKGGFRAAAKERLGLLQRGGTGVRTNAMSIHGFIFLIFIS